MTSKLKLCVAILHTCTLADLKSCRCAHLQHIKHCRRGETPKQKHPDSQRLTKNYVHLRSDRVSHTRPGRLLPLQTKGFTGVPRYRYRYPLGIDRRPSEAWDPRRSVVRLRVCHRWLDQHPGYHLTRRSHPARD